MIDFSQVQKDVQRILADAVPKCGVYHQEPPRGKDGVVLPKFPYLVYSYAISEGDESGEKRIALSIDVWATSTGDCFRQYMLADDALDDASYTMPSGVFFCHRNGIIGQRGQSDPHDERIKRMNGQYLMRFYPKI